jgi:hypothetical protein
MYKVTASNGEITHEVEFENKYFANLAVKQAKLMGYEAEISNDA